MVRMVFSKTRTRRADSAEPELEALPAEPAPSSSMPASIVKPTRLEQAAEAQSAAIQAAIKGAASGEPTALKHLEVSCTLRARKDLMNSRETAV
jgi:hypothetical protein